jgi:prefoldin subunit 5
VTPTDDELVAVFRQIRAQLNRIEQRVDALTTAVEAVDVRLEPIETGMKIVNKIVDQYEPAFRELAHAAAQ